VTGGIIRPSHKSVTTTSPKVSNMVTSELPTAAM
jgi:hypothetical protein